MRSVERGAALLEVLLALAILALAGASWIGLLAGHARALTALRQREAELADEDRLLTAYALLGRQDLERRIGAHEVGPYVVSVQLPDRRLFRIVIGRRADTLTEDVVTVLYREANDAP